MQEPDNSKLVVVAVLFWLRTYSRDSPQWLGLEKWLKLIVPYSHDIKLGLNVPEMQAGKLVVSDGTIVDYAGPGRFLYCSQSFRRELDLDLYGAPAIQRNVHINYIEWALHTAILMLAKSGKPWNRDQSYQFNRTVGGMQVADFL